MSATIRRTFLALSAAAAAAAAYHAGLRAQLRYGSAPEEEHGTFLGDDLIPDASLVSTRAITIDAPPAAVWPWIAQIGQGRGGFYSYDALENLAGYDIHSADHVESAWQDVAVGDEVHLTPESSMPVAVVERDEALVLNRAGPVGDDGPVPFDFVWAFVLRPLPGGRTRLVVRERYGYRTGWAGRLVTPASWVSFVMTERMLRGIRDRAEAYAGTPR
jgi:hypothetical protein